jgi:hypothetical protein
VIVFAWFSRPSAESMAIGIPISLLGLALRAWAAGCLAKNRELATGGPYAYTRNPLYIGTLLVAAGLAIAARSPGLAALFAAVFLLVYLPVIQNEEQHLRQIFPEYAAYASRVPALPVDSAGDSAARKIESFRAALYLRNQSTKPAWILGRDAVPSLENAGLGSCAHGQGGRFTDSLPSVFEVGMRFRTAEAILARIRRPILPRSPSCDRLATAHLIRKIAHHLELVSLQPRRGPFGHAVLDPDVAPTRTSAW